MASKLGKIVAAGVVVGASAAAFAIYKKKCDAFEKELEDDFEDEDVAEERPYTSISISDENEEETKKEEDASTKEA